VGDGEGEKRTGEKARPAPKKSGETKMMAVRDMPEVRRMAMMQLRKTNSSEMGATM